MRGSVQACLGITTSALLLAGCVTTGGDQSETLQAAASPAWALDTAQQEMIVAVSPVRQTLQIGGTTAALVGAGISAISDARHRRAIMEVLEDYPAGSIFEAHLAERLEAAFDGDITRVAPLGSTAGYSQRSDAEDARYASLSKQGHDLLVELDMTYGIYGYDGTLVAKIGGSIHDLPQGSTKWRSAYVVSSQPIVASDKLTDPTKRLGANLTNPRLTVDENAIDQWTGDGGVTLRSRYEQAVEGVVSALLTDLGLADEALGHYYLGYHFMNKKDFEKAEQHYRRALALEPDNLNAKNGLAVNLGHDGQLEEAIQLALEVVEAHPEHGAAHHNLAWWYATEVADAEKAAHHYDRSLELGMHSEKKIEKFLDR